MIYWIDVPSSPPIILTKKKTETKKLMLCIIKIMSWWDISRKEKEEVNEKVCDYYKWDIAEIPGIMVSKYHHVHLVCN